jgi:ABC-type multidrug transport system ATPase subunit
MAPESRFDPFAEAGSPGGPVRAHGRGGAGPAPWVRVEGAGVRRPSGRRVLDGVTFEIHPGEVVAVVGPNGAGKSTLLAALLGFLEPDSGAITIGGYPAATYRRCFGVGYLPDAAAFPEGWSPASILREGIRIAGLRGSEAMEALSLAVERASLPPSALRAPAETLSRGMARRLACALVLLGEPRWILLDEPEGALDLPSRTALLATLRRAADCGAAILLTGHEPPPADGLIDRWHLLEGGRLSGARRPAEAHGDALVEVHVDALVEAHGEVGGTGDAGSLGADG